MKNIIYTLALFIFSSISIYGQAPAWQWVKSAIGEGSDEGVSIATDVNGNVYATGMRAPNSITFDTITLPNAGGSNGNFFLVKYDPNGNAIWAKSANGTLVEAGMGITVDPSGNVLITGYFSSPSLSFGTITLTNAGGEDFFIVKYDQNGNALWAKSSVGTDNALGASISTDAIGNAYVTGSFFYTSITFDTATLNNAGGNDIFVVKYDPNGNLLWAKSVGGANSDMGKGICNDPNGNVLVTGYFSSNSVSFDSLTLTNSTASSQEFFVVKYDSNGNALWAKSGSGTNSEHGQSISSDPDGNILITGSFSSNAVTFDNIILSGGTNYDCFIVKYDGNGNALWGKSAGGAFGDNGMGIKTDQNSNIFVTGYFGSSSITFGTNTLNLGNMGQSFFVVKYDENGNALWSKSAEGPGEIFSAAIALDVNGNVFITGAFFSPSITIGPVTIDNTSSALEFFIVKTGGVTGFEENFVQYKITASPNPFFSQTTLFSDIPLKNATLNIFNILGQPVQEMQNISGQTINLNRENIKSGHYYIHITEENKIISVNKLVVID